MVIYVSGLTVFVYKCVVSSYQLFLLKFYVPRVGDFLIEDDCFEISGFLKARESFFFSSLPFNAILSSGL